MNIEALLQQYLFCACISEYRGSVKSLIEMIFWATGERISTRRIEELISKNSHIGGYYLLSFSANTGCKERVVRICKLQYANI